MFGFHFVDSYSEFKKQLHDLFPVIYDTKHLSLQLRRVSVKYYFSPPEWTVLGLPCT